MDPSDKELLDFLEKMVNENRLELLSRIMQDRTRYITVVLEDLYQPHNASAVLRTCDCFGIQDVHIVENRNEYTLNPEVELGSAQWLNLYRYNINENNTHDAIDGLKNEGYRIVATTPHKNNVDLPDFNLEKGKVALMFGTEMRGLSDRALEMADEYLKIPMFGFSESLNISVSAAIVLQNLRAKLRNSEIEWQLKNAEKAQIQLQWIRNSVNNSIIIERDFKKRFQK
jgi:tRNA (guanosine-2'-O-)-methyltransferase